MNRTRLSILAMVALGLFLNGAQAQDRPADQPGETGGKKGAETRKSKKTQVGKKAKRGSKARGKSNRGAKQQKGPKAAEKARKKAEQDAKDKVEQAKVTATIGAATRLFKAEKHGQALELFRSVVEKAGPRKPQIHFAIARCLQELGRYEEALGAFQAFLEMKAPPEAKGRAEMAIRVIQKRIATGKLILQVSPFGATVAVDGTQMGEAPLDPLELPPGSHQVMIMAEGHETVEQEVDLPGGGEVSITVSLVKLHQIIADHDEPISPTGVPSSDRAAGFSGSQKTPGPAIAFVAGPPPVAIKAATQEPTPPKAARPEPKPEPPAPPVTVQAPVPRPDLSLTAEAPPSYRPWAWAALGAGGATVLGGIIAIGLGDADHKKVTSAEGYGTGELVDMTQRRAQSLMDSGDTKKAAGGVLVGVGSAALVSSLVLFLIEPVDPKTGPSLAASPVDGGGLVTLLGRF